MSMTTQRRSVGVETPVSAIPFPDGVRAGTDTRLGGSFSCEVRVGGEGDRLIAGNGCVLECRAVFERDRGSIRIGDRTFIGRSNLICVCDLTIGSDVLIAWGCTIIDHDSHSISWEERAEDVALWRQGLRDGPLGAARLKRWEHVPMAAVHIGDKVWIGFNCIVLKGVCIGEGAVVGAGSVVTRDVPAWTLAAGNPARVVKTIPRREVTST